MVHGFGNAIISEFTFHFAELDAFSQLFNPIKGNMLDNRR